MIGQGKKPLSDQPISDKISLLFALAILRKLSNTFPKIFFECQCWLFLTFINNFARPYFVIFIWLEQLFHGFLQMALCILAWLILAQVFINLNLESSPFHDVFVDLLIRLGPLAWTVVWIIMLNVNFIYTRVGDLVY